jgi:hypothetical protein
MRDALAEWGSMPPKQAMISVSRAVFIALLSLCKNSSMLKAFKVRIYPTDEQSITLAKMFG